ncbi:MAG: LamG-like jellyroll fold domain-containing protein, partial [Patescibacteria group bacterium]
NNNHGSNLPSVATGPTWVNTNGTFYSWDGVDDNGFNAGSISQTTPSTLGISVWVRTRHDSQTAAYVNRWSYTAGLKSFYLFKDSIVTYNLYFALYQSNDALVECNVSNLTAAFWGTNPGLWHHLGVVADGTNIFVYIDGTNKVSTTYNGTIDTNNAPVMIGSLYPDGLYRTTDGIDDARYFASLTTQQLINIFNSTKTNAPYFFAP